MTMQKTLKGVFLVCLAATSSQMLVASAATRGLEIRPSYIQSAAQPVPVEWRGVIQREMQVTALPISTTTRDRQGMRIAGGTVGQDSTINIKKLQLVGSAIAYKQANSNQYKPNPLMQSMTVRF